MMNKKIFVFIYKKYILSRDTYIYLNIFSLLNIKQKNKIKNGQN